MPIATLDTRSLKKEKSTKKRLEPDKPHNHLQAGALRFIEWDAGYVCPKVPQCCAGTPPKMENGTEGEQEREEGEADGPIETNRIICLVMIQDESTLKEPMQVQ